MGWLLKNYKCYVFICGPKGKKIYEYKHWSRITDLMKSFIKSDFNSVAIRSSQLSLQNKKRIKFGRLKLDDESNKKWTHKSIITNDSSDNWEFMDAEAWLPSWNNCEKLDESPDFYFNISNENPPKGTRFIQFDQKVIMAFSLEKYSLDSIKKFVSDLHDYIKPIFAIEKQRKWANKFLSSFTTNSINDLTISGLFKSGDRQIRPLDLNTFEEDWTILNQ